MFEIRLQELREAIDQFFIVESRQTFRGKPKQLAYPRVLPNLPGAVTSKIHYTVLDQLKGKGAWAKETFQRNSMLHIALNRSGILPHPGDIFLISDLDEIPKPEFVRAMKLCSGISYPASLASSLHYYSFNLDKGEPWTMGPRAMLASQQGDITAQNLRKDTPVTQYQNASWHCRCALHVAVRH
jgi:beta-1,4-mannosyl-glycoprotein beta-1,4-N-acetylglucosaminyltransferase